MTFGERMRALMAERGISLRRLAKTIHYDPGHLSKVSHDLKPSSAELARALDDALGASGELADLAPARTRLLRPIGAATVITPDDEERLYLAARAPRRHDPGIVDALSAVLAGQRRSEDLIGSAPLVEPVRAQLAVVETLVREARGDLRARVVDIAAQWAQFASWLYISIGNLDAAAAWLDRAAEWALEAGHATMLATVLSFKGEIAYKRGQTGSMIGLAQAAQRDPSVHMAQRAFDAQFEARGHAIAGDADAARRRLDDARTRADEIADELPPWMYYKTPEFMALDRGIVYRYLGRHDPTVNDLAIDTLTSGLAALPADMQHSEWAGDFVYQLGLVFLQVNKEAREQAARLAVLAERIGSKRLARQAAALRHVTTPPTT